MEKRRWKPSLTQKILAGLVLGILAGIVLMPNPALAETYIKPFGTLFLNLIKFIVVPIVLFSILGGIISIKDTKKVGAIGLKTVVFYLATTLFATVIGLTVANLLRGFFVPLSTSGLSYEPAASPTFLETLVGMFPSNAIAPLLEANMLQIIVIALFFGFGILLAGQKGALFGQFIESANAVSIKVMSIILHLSPFGVFCLLAPVVATNGPSILGSLAVALGIAYLAYFIHMALVYSLSVKLAAGLSPLTFFKEMVPAMAMAFSSASSIGTLPLSLACSKKLGADNDIASFVLPLGATINMDGTAIYQGVCAVFIASSFGVQLTLVQMITIVATATLASIGTAGVPGSGIIMLSMVLQSVGLPVEGIALVIGVDRIFDMGRTTVNITGDAACAIVVTALEKRAEKKRARTTTL